MKKTYKKLTAVMITVAMLFSQFLVAYASDVTTQATTQVTAQQSTSTVSAKQSLIDEKKKQVAAKALLERQKSEEAVSLEPLKTSNTINTSSGTHIVPGKMIVKYKDNVSSAQMSSLNAKVSALSATTNKKLGFTELNLPKSTNVQKAVDKLKDDPNVEYVEPVYERNAFIIDDSAVASDNCQEEYYKNGWQWGLQAMTMEDMWSSVDKDALSNITIAIIDTGVDTSCSEFPQSMMVSGYDFINNDEDPDDDYGHGTHVAGIAAAAWAGPDIEKSGMAGVAGGAKIMPVKALDENGSGDSISIVNSILFAVKNGANVINMSLGGYGYSHAEEAAVEYAIGKGVIVVAAAGNEGYSYAAYPAAYDGVICVGAADWNGIGLEIADFSNYGEDIDVVAPGVDILSTVPVELDDFDHIGDGTADGYALLNGTSMATPFVAGMAALILANNDIMDLYKGDVLAAMKEDAKKFTYDGTEYSFISGDSEEAIGDSLVFNRLELSIDIGTSGKGVTSPERVLTLSNDHRNIATGDVYSDFEIKMAELNVDEDGYIEEIKVIDNTNYKTGDDGTLTVTIPEKNGYYAFYAVGKDGYLDSGMVYTLYEGVASEAEADNDGNTSFKEAVELKLGNEISSSIGTRGDIDYYKFTVDTAGYYMITSTGDTDTFGYLFGADNEFLVDDDDSGANYNFAITKYLDPGTYYVQVEGLDESVTGDYGIVVKSTSVITGTVSLPDSAVADGEDGMYVFIDRLSKTLNPVTENYEYYYEDFQLVNIASGDTSAEYIFTVDENSESIIGYSPAYDLPTITSDCVGVGYYYNPDGKTDSIQTSIDKASAVPANGAANLTFIKAALVEADQVKNDAALATELKVSDTNTSTYTSDMDYYGDVDYYSLNVVKSGNYIIECSSANYGMSIQIFDSGETEIYPKYTSSGYSSDGSYVRYVVNFEKSGSYYIAVNDGLYTPFKSYEYELNVVPGLEISGDITLVDAANNSMCGLVTAKKPATDKTAAVYYDSGFSIAKDGTGTDYSVYVPAANGYILSYYLDTTQYAGVGYYSTNGMKLDPVAESSFDMSSDKKIDLSLIPLSGISDENNNDKTSATALTLGTKEPGTINYYADEDYFKFHVSEAGEYEIKINGPLSIGVYLLDNSGKWTDYDENSMTDENGVTDMVKTLDANDEGEYYYLMLCGTGKNISSYELTVNCTSGPVASNVAITGTAKVGNTLTGSYTYTDANGYTESGTTYKWLRASTVDGAYTAISGATSKTYTLTSSDLGKYIKFEVTPRAAKEPNIGTAVRSGAVGPIAAATIADDETDDTNSNDSPSDEPTGDISPTPTPVATVPGTTGITQNTGSGTATITTEANGSVSANVNVDAAKLSDALAAPGTAPVIIDAKTTAEANKETASIPGNVFAQAKESQKPLVVETNNVTFGIEPGTLDTSDSNEQVKLGVTQLSLDAVPEAAKNVDAAANEVSMVFDFDLSIGDKNITTFNKPMTITVKYDPTLVTDASKVGVYYYNEKDGKWDYVGGKVNADGTITFTVEHFSKYTVMEYKKTFDDIKTHWAKAEIELMAAKHVTNGITESNFEPDAKITRAAFASMLIRALGIKAAETQNVFKDIPDDIWYKSDVNKAFAAKIISGRTNNKFAPNEYITREEMATMVMRAYAYSSGRNLDSIITTMEKRYSDEGAAQDWARRNIVLADALGLMKGNPNGAFMPKEKTTRAQAVVVIKRLMEKLNLL